MKIHTIDIGDGARAMYATELEGQEACDRFEELANHCFGLRKNIFQVVIVETKEINPVTEVIAHGGEMGGGDVILYDEDGRKLRDEWGDWGAKALNTGGDEEESKPEPEPPPVEVCPQCGNEEFRVDPDGGRRRCLKLGCDTTWLAPKELG